MSLADILFRQAAAQGPVAPQPPGALSPGADQTVAALENQAFAPNPADEQPKALGFGRRLTLALADAANAYAAGMGAGSRTDYTGQARNRLEAQAAQKNKANLTEAERKRSQAGYKLNRILGAQEKKQAREQATLDMAAELEAKRDLQKEEAVQKAADLEAKQTFEAQQNELDRKSKMQVAEYEGGVRKHIADAEGHAQIKGMEKELTLGQARALELRDGVPPNPKDPNDKGEPGIGERIANGESPAAILDGYIEDLDRLGVMGEARKRAISYFNEKAKAAFNAGAFPLPPNMPGAAQ